ncbi:MAG TPA: hypothetical protein VGT60_10965 [Candidatus Limnocylindria bacterium]|nr:hypothetical protein [Candidatus Limnocylindria bacterium]
MRSFIVVGAAVAVTALLIALLAAVRSPGPGGSTALASPTPSATAAGTPTPTAAVVTPAPSPTPDPTPTRMYVNTTWKFSVVLPDPYRRSARLSIANSGGSRPAAADAFTARTEAAEAALADQRCETACAIWNYAAVIDVFTGTGARSPRDFYNAFSYSRDQQLEDITVDGHVALKVTNAPSYPVEYLIKDGDRMFMLGYTIYQPGTFDVPPGASKAKLDAILGSFTFVP